VKLLEYEAKTILAAGTVPVPKSYLAGDTPEFLPAVLKSQVPVGGRGKAGGVVIANNEESYQDTKATLLQLAIKGFRPQVILAEELIDIDRELYLSLLIDKPTASIVLMAHRRGGVEVEANDASEFLRLPLDGKNTEAVGQQLADYYDLADKTFALQDLIEQLYKCLTVNDALLLEINPLILAKNGQILAGDCKLELDDAAVFRHPEWHFEAEKTEVNFVTLDSAGNVATVANGAGLAMATVDAVADTGLTPANFLDVGGGASEASVLAAFQRIMEYPHIQVIIINIFAGITRCDEVAKAVLAARSHIPHLPRLEIRLAGTNFDEAADLLAKESIAIHPTLTDAVIAAKGTVS
jgi:succinyl-CoA synthetase beta subunit